MKRESPNYGIGDWRDVLSISDLCFLFENNIAIEPEVFERTRLHENTHRDFAPCSGCGAKTFEQHLPECPRETVLALPDWYWAIRALEERPVCLHCGRTIKLTSYNGRPVWAHVPQLAGNHFPNTPCETRQVKSTVN